MPSDGALVKEAIEAQTQAIRDNTAALLTLALQVLAAASGNTSGSIDQARINNVAKLFDDLGPVVQP